MKKHVNIPIFIPHLGCPNQCVFCNQRSISGVYEFHPETVRQTIEEALSTIPTECEVEIAYFGGSFTGIDRELMIELLTIAHSYILDGRVSSVRCSTRPDYINGPILDILREYGVKTIELGLQSIDDEVLLSTKRGHSFSAEREACRMIKEYGFDLVGQMMIGLPGSTLEKELATADFIINSDAVGARIYPTVVFRDTELCDLTTMGLYLPLSVEEAVERSAAVMKRFFDFGVNIIRIGLCSSENLSDEKTYFAGPNHPAIGELVENEFYFRNICDELKKKDVKANSVLLVTVSKGNLSKAIGHKKINKIKLKEEFSLSDVIFSESSQIFGYEFTAQLKEGII